MQYSSLVFIGTGFTVPIALIFKLFALGKQQITDHRRQSCLKEGGVIKGRSGKYCYIRTRNASATWQQNFDVCQQMNAQMVTVMSGRQNKQIRKIIRKVSIKSIA